MKQHSYAMIYCKNLIKVVTFQLMHHSSSDHSNLKPSQIELLMVSL